MNSEHDSQGDVDDPSPKNIQETEQKDASKKFLAEIETSPIPLIESPVQKNENELDVGKLQGQTTPKNNQEKVDVKDNTNIGNTFMSPPTFKYKSGQKSKEIQMSAKDFGTACMNQLNQKHVQLVSKRSSNVGASPTGIHKRKRSNLFYLDGKSPVGSIDKNMLNQDLQDFIDKNKPKPGRHISRRIPNTQRKKSKFIDSETRQKIQRESNMIESNTFQSPKFKQKEQDATSFSIESQAEVMPYTQLFDSAKLATDPDQVTPMSNIMGTNLSMINQRTQSQFKSDIEQKESTIIQSKEYENSKIEKKQDNFQIGLKSSVKNKIQERKQKQTVDTQNLSPRPDETLTEQTKVRCESRTNQIGDQTNFQSDAEIDLMILQQSPKEKIDPTKNEMISPQKPSNAIISLSNKKRDIRNIEIKDFNQNKPLLIGKDQQLINQIQQQIQQNQLTISDFQQLQQKKSRLKVASSLESNKNQDTIDSNPIPALEKTQLKFVNIGLQQNVLDNLKYKTYLDLPKTQNVQRSSKIDLRDKGKKFQRQILLENIQKQIKNHGLLKQTSKNNKMSLSPETSNADFEKYMNMTGQTMRQQAPYDGELSQNTTAQFWNSQINQMSMSQEPPRRKPKDNKSHLQKVIGSKQQQLTFNQFQKMLVEQGLKLGDNRQDKSQIQHLVFQKYNLINSIMGGQSREANQLKRKYLKMILSKSINTEKIMPIIELQSIHNSHLNTAKLREKQMMRKAPDQQLEYDSAKLNPALFRNTSSFVSVESIKKTESSYMSQQNFNKYVHTNSRSGSNQKSEEKINLNLEGIKSTSININDGIESYNQMRKRDERSRTFSMQQSDSQFYSPIKSKRDLTTETNNKIDSIQLSRYHVDHLRSNKKNLESVHSDSGTQLKFKQNNDLKNAELTPIESQMYYEGFDKSLKVRKNVSSPVDQQQSFQLILPQKDKFQIGMTQEQNKNQDNHINPNQNQKDSYIDLNENQQESQKQKDDKKFNAMKYKMINISSSQYLIAPNQEKQENEKSDKKQNEILSSDRTDRIDLEPTFMSQNDLNQKQENLQKNNQVDYIKNNKQLVVKQQKFEQQQPSLKIKQFNMDLNDNQLPNENQENSIRDTPEIKQDIIKHDIKLPSINMESENRQQNTVSNFRQNESKIQMIQQSTVKNVNFQYPKLQNEKYYEQENRDNQNLPVLQGGKNRVEMPISITMRGKSRQAQLIDNIQERLDQNIRKVATASNEPIQIHQEPSIRSPWRQDERSNHLYLSQDHNSIEGQFQLSPQLTKEEFTSGSLESKKMGNKLNQFRKFDISSQMLVASQGQQNEYYQLPSQMQLIQKLNMLKKTQRFGDINFMKGGQYAANIFSSKQRLGQMQASSLRQPDGLKQAVDLKRFKLKKKRAQNHRPSNIEIPNPSSMKDLVSDKQFLGNLQKRMFDEADEMNTCDRVKALSMSAKHVASGRYGVGPNAYTQVRLDSAKKKIELERLNQTIREKNQNRILQQRAKYNRTLNDNQKIDQLNISLYSSLIPPSTVVQKIQLREKKYQPTSILEQITKKQDRQRQSSSLLQIQEQQRQSRAKIIQQFPLTDQDEDDSLVDYFTEENNTNANKTSNGGYQPSRKLERADPDSISQFKPTGFSHRVLDQIVIEESKHSKKDDSKKSKNYEGQQIDSESLQSLKQVSMGFQDITKSLNEDRKDSRENTLEIPENLDEQKQKYPAIYIANYAVESKD